MDKIKILKKGGLVAIGLASITTKKADQLINSLVKKGRLSQKQGETLAKKVISETFKEQQKIRKQVVGEVAKSAKRVISVAEQEAKRLAKKIKPPKKKVKKKAKKKKTKKRR